MIELIPSPTNLEEEGETHSVMVVTRAQAKAALEIGKPSIPNKSKRRRKMQKQKKREKSLSLNSEKNLSQSGDKTIRPNQNIPAKQPAVHPV